MVDMAMAKKPRRSCTPLGESSRRQKMVARMNPVTSTAASRMMKISGVRFVLMKARRVSTPISTQNGFANLDTAEAGAGAAAECTDTDPSFPGPVGHGLQLPDEVERELRGVLVPGDGFAEVVEVGRQRARRAVVHRLAAGQE
ncbi:hypothetical protein U9M48_007033 [Paspalum notatum var. saurae]|uniref:Uncharacterized protein n=1 Tax=Paspalum notatum var. saurae TaxID=547442 RepID=A0AAQ3PUL5_PASNO